jgi:hypothetical protein
VEADLVNQQSFHDKPKKSSADEPHEETMSTFLKELKVNHRRSVKRMNRKSKQPITEPSAEHQNGLETKETQKIDDTIVIGSHRRLVAHMTSARAFLEFDQVH